MLESSKNFVIHPSTSRAHNRVLATSKLPILLVMFKVIFRFCFPWFFPPDDSEADILRKKANEACNANHTNLEDASSTFRRANMHWEAYNAPVAPAIHLKEAISLYEKTLEVWKDVNPKPKEYLEVLRNLGKAYYDLFDADIDQETKSTLRTSTLYYERAFKYASEHGISPNLSEHHQILGSNAWKGYKLENSDIGLDQAIDQLSSAYKAHTSDIPFFEDLVSSCPHLVNVRSAADHLTSIIDRSPNSPQIRDQALLHLCQALHFRKNYKKVEKSKELIRAEAVARSAIPVVSQDVGTELKKILVLIQHQNDQQGIDVGKGSSSTSAGLSSTTSKNGLPVDTNQATTAPSKKGRECRDGAPHPPPNPNPNPTPDPLPIKQGTSANSQRPLLSQSKNAFPPSQLPATHLSNQKNPVTAMTRMSQSSSI